MDAGNGLRRPRVPPSDSRRSLATPWLARLTNDRTRLIAKPQKLMHAVRCADCRTPETASFVLRTADGAKTHAMSRLEWSPLSIESDARLVDIARRYVATVPGFRQRLEAAIEETYADQTDSGREDMQSERVGVYIDHYGGRSPGDDVLPSPMVYSDDENQSPHAEVDHIRRILQEAAREQARQARARSEAGDDVRAGVSQQQVRHVPNVELTASAAAQTDWQAHGFHAVETRADDANAGHR